MSHFKSNVRAVGEVVTKPKTRKPDGHHTIPIYLCGAKTQSVSYLDRSSHAALHSGLAKVEAAVQKAENFADDRVTLTRRRTSGVLKLAQTEQGRGAIANAISSFYQIGGWWGQGQPFIGGVFQSERAAYVDGRKTSLPECTRKK